MHELMLFTDGSVDTKTRIGFGAYLAINSMEPSLADLKTKVKVKKFENTSSTTLELKTLLWAMDDAFLLRTEKTKRIAVYSDSQNILGLLARRSGLEARKFFSRNGKQLNNTELYQQFFKAMDCAIARLLKWMGINPGTVKMILISYLHWLIRLRALLCANLIAKYPSRMAQSKTVLTVLPPLSSHLP